MQPRRLRDCAPCPPPGSFRTRPECEHHYYLYLDDDVFAALPKARSGSCGWDSRVRRCTILPPQKEPCLLDAFAETITAATSARPRYLKGGLVSDRTRASGEP